MRCKFILLLASQIQPESAPTPKNGRAIMRSSYRGPGARRGVSDPEQTRQLALSIYQGILLKAGHITWVTANLTPCVVTINRLEAANDPAKA
ncbi:MAG: hypothetical protein WC750_03330 [Patescibacteria group bacterium]